MVTFCVPSTIASSTAAILNGSEVICPAAIVTVAGTVASLVSSLTRSTVKAAIVSVLRVTVAVVLPSVSLIKSATIDSVKAVADTMTWTPVEH